MTIVKSFLIYLISIALNCGLGFLANLIFYGEDLSKFIFCAYCFVALFSLIIFIIANKKNVKLELIRSSSNTEEEHILCTMFIGQLYSIIAILLLSILIQ